MRNGATESPFTRRIREPASTRISPAYKPGSVGTPRYTGRSFLSACRHRHAPAAYPRFTASARRRGSPFETGRLSPPIWPCSGRGLPSHVRYRPCGGLLPHPFTLTALLRGRRFAFCCTVRCVKLSPHAPRRYLATCPVEPGLSSEPGRDHNGPSPNFATVRPTTSVSRNIAGRGGNDGGGLVRRLPRRWREPSGEERRNKGKSVVPSTGNSGALFPAERIARSPLPLRSLPGGLDPSSRKLPGADPDCRSATQMTPPESIPRTPDQVASQS